MGNSWNRSFFCKNVFAAEYFDFSGEVFGKVVEFETGATFGEQSAVTNQNESFSEFSLKLKDRIKQELSKTGEVDEDKLVEFVTIIHRR